ncbi:MAG: serine--tRNA ligase [Planctomycetes bacterium]|nr:serine--tRNA ligase [Planctomycetota bacterium]
MLDLAAIRADPERYRAGLAAKGMPSELLDGLLELDRRHRESLHNLERLHARKNAASKTVAEEKKQGRDASSTIRDMQALGERQDALQADVDTLERRLGESLLSIPNVADPDVPVGADPSANRIVRTWGEPLRHAFPARPHWEIGERLGIIDWERGSRVAGQRFYYLKGDGARLERLLGHWMLERHVKEDGYTELGVPLLVRPEALEGTAQLPKFSAEMYRCADDPLYLIPTAEVPIVNFHREEVIPAGSLPLRYTAFCANFRREAGAAGRQTRGLVRGHQFYKVEMVAFSKPEESAREHEKMLGDAERILQALGLAYRVALVCTGEMTFANARQYDLEVWAPGVGEWLEVSSVSNCRDFQARRARIRYKEEGGKLRPPHILNGTGVALPRTIAALLETYQRADGSVALPEPAREALGKEMLA